METHEITSLLERLDHGEVGAEALLGEAVYPRLKAIARRQMRQERAGHTLQPTALVNEAYLQLFDSGQRNWRNRAQFFAYASAVMRHILVRHARDRNAAKRGGKALRVTLNGLPDSSGVDEDLLALDAALTGLAELDRRQARLVELRFFGGLAIAEIAEVMDLSESSVNKQLRAARGWLYQQLKAD